MCEPEIVQKLRGNCLLLSFRIPSQIYPGEKTTVNLFIRQFFVMSIILMVLNFLLVKNLEWSPLPTYTANLLLISHLFATGIELPGAMAEFNGKIVEVATLNFRDILAQSEHAAENHIINHKHGLLYAGYQFISAWKN